MNNTTHATVYAADTLAHRNDVDIIKPAEAKTLYGLFQQRVSRSPDKTAYHQFESGKWRQYSWQEMSSLVDRWRSAFVAAGLKQGDRIAILQRNSTHWVCFDQAAHAQGLVVVPLYMEDRAENMAYIMELTQSQLLFIDSASHWEELRAEKTTDLKFLKIIVALESFDHCSDQRVVRLDAWLPELTIDLPQAIDDPHALATIVFTSGTTGKPKGVMITHNNILENAYACAQYGPFFSSDLFISFLPLSHTFERTVGYYMTIMASCEVAYARSIPELSEDLQYHKPTVMVTVPRIFERVYQKIMTQLNEGSSLKKSLFEKTVEIGWNKFQHAQGRGTSKLNFLLWPVLDKLVASKVREKLGGRLRVAIAGGAPLPFIVGKTFLGLGVNVVQGYGMTETSPVLSSNLVERNKPESIGLPLLGVELKLGENNEILAKGPNVMKGYWQNEQATEDTFTDDGWLKTGDCGKIDKDGFIHIIGRIKEILVLANGEKVPPADMESAIAEDALFEQSMVIGEGKPYLTALLVLNKELWQKEAEALGVSGNDESVLKDPKIEEFLVNRIAERIEHFPGYAQIYKANATLESWTVDNGLLTPTLKLKRPVLRERFAAEISRLYKGH